MFPILTDRRVLSGLLGSALSVCLVLGAGQVPAAAAPADTPVLDRDAILAANGIDEPQWYKDNIPFVDTPDDAIDSVYYYRWSTYKRALRYTVPGTGYVSTEYDNPVWYAGTGFSGGNEAHSALSDAAGYHIQDGRWLRNPDYAGDTLNFWLRGGGNFSVRNFSEWLTSAAYQRYLVTGDAAELKANLPQFIDLYRKWDGNFKTNITVNGTASGSGLYAQTPLADATEFTETSMHSSDWFGGGAGYRPTINAYMYSAAQAISRIATMTGDDRIATEYAAKAAALKAGVQKALWDPQRQFFMHVYDTNGSNGALKNTRTTWREAMGYAPWAFGLPDPDPKYAAAWQYLTDPQRFGAAHGPTTLERVHDFEAEQAARNHANPHDAASASNGGYVGQIDFDDSHVTFTVDAPGAGTYPVSVFFANGTGAPATHALVVNGATDSPITVTYPATAAWGQFSDKQAVTVQVPMKAGANTLRFGKGTGFAELDKITANPYFGYDAFPAQQNRDDSKCCHWNGPSWPFATSQILTGLANLLQDYPAQDYVTKETYQKLLKQFATLQHKDGKPYVAEAANADTGEWVYDGINFSEHYNHSSFNDLVLTGLLGIKPQADDTLVLKPLIPDGWDYFAVQDLPYHGHQLTIVWDRDGTHYRHGAGLQVFQDGKRIHQADAIGAARIPVDPPVAPAAKTRLENVAANPLAADQAWLNSWAPRAVSQPNPKAFASYTNTASNGRRCRSSDNPRCVDNFDAPGNATDGWIRYDGTPDNRWTNAGSPNATDHLGVDFGAARPINEVKLYPYDDGADIRVPQDYDVQYLAGDQWKSIPGQTRNPARPRANSANEVTFPAVRTSQFRVVFTPQPGKAVGVTELESWYPQRPGVRIVNKNSGLELGIADASTGYGAAAVQQAADPSRNHQWQLAPADQGYYKIINGNSGLVLGILNAAKDRGVTALQWGDNLTADHLWSVVDAGGGYSKLVNRNSGLVLGIKDASTAAGAPALQWDDSGTDDHLWKLVTADGRTPFAAGAVTINEVSQPSGPVPPGTEVTLTARFTDTSADPDHTCMADWGDSTTTVAAAGTCTLAHTYRAEGRYTATVTVTNTNADAAAKAVTVQVTKPATLALTSVDPASVAGGGTRTITLHGTSLDARDSVEVTTTANRRIGATVKSVSADGTSMTADVDLGTAAPGRASVTIRPYGTDRKPVTLVNAFTITVPVLTAAAPPKITGAVAVGVTVRATTGTWQPAASSYAYQWAANGRAIAGARSASYSIPAAMLGKTLTVTVTAKRPGYLSGTATSAVTAPIGCGAAPGAVYRPKITGWPAVGQTVYATPGLWWPQADRYRYEWRLDGVVIHGATRASLKLASAMRNKRLTVTVIAVKAGHADGSATSPPVTVHR